MKLIRVGKGAMYRTHDYDFCPLAWGRDECWCDVLHASKMEAFMPTQQRINELVKGLSND